MKQTIAHVKYENHVKESLLSGKPVEYNLKDFIPQNNSKKTTRQRTKYEKIVYDVFKKAKEIFPKMHDDMFIRHGYIAEEMAYLMSQCDTIEEVRELYNTWKHITYNTPCHKY